MAPQSLSPDDELVCAARAGDENAFKVLVERYERLTGKLASRFFKQPDLIEEITQISFTQAWCALDSYETRGENSFVSWLARITINTCNDELRRARRRREDAFSKVEESAALFIEGDRQTAGLERAAISRDLVARLMARHEPEDRLVLTLLKIEGWSVAEIANLLAWSPAKVKMRVHRARHIFQRALPKYC